MENYCWAMVKHFLSCRDSQVVLRVQLRARGNGHPSHKHQKKPMYLLVVGQSVLTVAQYGYHPHKDSGARSFQGYVKQDILEPAPEEEVLQFDSPAEDISNERLGLGCYQVNDKYLKLLWSNCFGYSQVHNRPQSRRRYLPLDQDGMVGHMLHLYKNSNSGFATLVSQGMYLGRGA